MRIVITGATGFIGSNLAKLFLKKGAEVFVLVRPESTHLDVLPKDEKLHVVSCGLSNVMDCVSYIKEADAFFHLAWGGVNRQEIDSPEVQAKNVAGSLDCIRAAKALNCRMFMDAGSRVEYGLTDGFMQEGRRDARPCGKRMAVIHFLPPVFPYNRKFWRGGGVLPPPLFCFPIAFSLLREDGV